MNKRKIIAMTMLTTMLAASALTKEVHAELRDETELQHTNDIADTQEEVEMSSETEEDDVQAESVSIGDIVTLEGINYKLCTKNGNKYFAVQRSQDATGDIVIEESIEGIPVTMIDNQAFSSNRNVTHVTLPTTISTIGENAFSYCYGLTAINIEDTQVTEIAKRCFMYCKSLTEITLPDTVERVQESAFSYCDHLTYFKLSNKVERLDICAFQNCSMLGTFDFNGADITKISGSTFYGCMALSSIEIPESVHLIENNAFRGSGINSICLGDCICQDNAFNPECVITYAELGQTAIPDIELSSDFYESGDKIVMTSRGYIDNEAVKYYVTFDGSEPEESNSLV